jgi:hypothetical protein
MPLSIVLRRAPVTIAMAVGLALAVWVDLAAYGCTKTPQAVTSGAPSGVSPPPDGSACAPDAYSVHDLPGSAGASADGK